MVLILLVLILLMILATIGAAYMAFWVGALLYLMVHEWRKGK